MFRLHEPFQLEQNTSFDTKYIDYTKILRLLQNT